MEIAFVGRGNDKWPGYWNDDHVHGLAGHNTNGYKPAASGSYDWSGRSQTQGTGHDTTCFGCTGVFGHRRAAAAAARTTTSRRPAARTP